MQFFRSTGPEQGIADLSKHIYGDLDVGRKVLWLVSGGSNIGPSVQVMDSIPGKLREGLTIMLCDERYGMPNHDESNAYQLVSAGFDYTPATFIPVLHKDAGIEETLQEYNENLRNELGRHQTIITQLGMGTDGHISGILPRTPAATEKDDLVVGYEKDPYIRLTTTFVALRRATDTYLFAFGEAKHRQLEILQQKKVKLVNQPVQLLKQLENVRVYTDQPPEPV